MNKEITDVNAINKIINQLFSAVPVYVKFFEAEYPIKIIMMREKAVVVKLPVRMDSKERILSLTHNNYRFIGEFLLLGGDNLGNEVLKPLKFRIEEAKRTEERVVIEHNDENDLTINNIMNHLAIGKAMGFSDKRVEAVVKSVQDTLSSKFPHSQLYLSARMDNRLRTMYNFDRSIFVPDRFDQRSVEPGFLPFEEYVKILRLNSLEERFVSEISAMIKYKGYTPLGYIQVLSEERLDNKAFNTVNLLANTISKGLVSTGMFNESRGKCKVHDLSEQGMSFMHPQSKFFSKAFTVGETIFFDLFKGDELKGTYRAIIRNIKNTETMFRVGCQFYNINHKEAEFLAELVDKQIADEENENAGIEELDES